MAKTMGGQLLPLELIDRCVGARPIPPSPFGTATPALVQRDRRHICRRVVSHLGVCQHCALEGTRPHCWATPRARLPAPSNVGCGQMM